MLPNQGMSFTAFDTLPAAELNKLIENIEALSDGSGIEAGAILPNHLFPSASPNNDWEMDTLTPTTSGWSGTPTTVFRYLKLGKICFLFIYVSGTSNAVTASITNLPFPSANVTNGQVSQLFRGVNNSSQVNNGQAYIPPNSSTIQFFPDVNSGNWTAAGTKVVDGYAGFYITA